MSTFFDLEKPNQHTHILTKHFLLSICLILYFMIHDPKYEQDKLMTLLNKANLQ